MYFRRKELSKYTLSQIQIMLENCAYGMSHIYYNIYFLYKLIYTEYAFMFTVDTLIGSPKSA